MNCVELMEMEEQGNTSSVQFKEDKKSLSNVEAPTKAKRRRKRNRAQRVKSTVQDQGRSEELVRITDWEQGQTKGLGQNIDRDQGLANKLGQCMDQNQGLFEDLKKSKEQRDVLLSDFIENLEESTMNCEELMEMEDQDDVSSVKFKKDKKQLDNLSTEPKENDVQEESLFEELHQAKVQTANVEAPTKAKRRRARKRVKWVKSTVQDQGLSEELAQITEREQTKELGQTSLVTSIMMVAAMREGVMVIPKIGIWDHRV
ncbi:uncharacterized protein LOC114472228 [Gouania willdenowi]|uniref:uncharacterized protein LOC114472228 n=1 Tax=Gouania willdenowi TaxID=441366 RepID=UPI001056D31C|nr:uncharacterized protein LOC114472228 [Gouania willdenowi]